MADINWQKVREVFDSALSRPPEERAEYLERACGEDKTLLSEVRSLFDSLESAESFLEKPAVAAVAENIEPCEKKLEKGARLGHYEILGQIGAGGMGEVYLARDTKLDREVALKILNEKFSRDEANLNRFIREAKAASALNHPNILVIHEIGASGDSPYIVSEYVKGQTLRDFLTEKHLSLREVLDIAVQIAGALVAAHEARLVHRDIKPENVMIRPDGLIKVLDFGLAKLVERKNRSILGLEESTLEHSQTARGMILGTVNYMSPEQAKGERVDERTDVFSLGVVLYEMLAGQTPFAGDSMPETFANLINADPKPLADYAEHPPAELQRIISKTLRKDRDARYQTMKGLLADLREFRENLTLEQKLDRSTKPDTQETVPPKAATANAHLQTAEMQSGFLRRLKKHKIIFALALVAMVLGAATFVYFFSKPPEKNAGNKKSIAVLPLKPINQGARDELYELGIAESLIYRLSLMKNFIVRPLSATRQYSDINQDPAEAGREQKTDYVLTSNYQLAGGKIRITAHLVNVENGQIEDTYKSEKETNDVFAVQDMVAVEIGNLLAERFGAVVHQQTAKRGTNNEEAYRLYLHAKNLVTNRRAESVRKAVETFEQAIRLDTNFAGAYAGLANAYIGTGNQGVGLPREEYEKARKAVTKALELDSGLAEGYAVLGNLKLHYEWDFDGAERDFRRAVELDPNIANTGYAALLSVRGRFDEAIAESKIALEIDPNSIGVNRDHGRILYLARRYDEAIIHFQRHSEVFGEIESWMILAYEMKGDTAGAYEWFIKTLRDPNEIRLFQSIYKSSGWDGIKRKRYELERSGENKPGSNFYRLARLSVLVGEKEQAFEYLRKAFEKRNGQLVMLNVEPVFDGLRDDKRFDEIVRQIGLK